MENKIVKDFENLKVFAQRNYIMDELVQDLTTALEETANVGRPGTSQAEGANSSTYPRRCMKKRRGLRRPASSSYYWKRGTISEASESSVDENPRRDYAGNVIHSDSDDLAACRRIPKLAVPVVDPIPPVESDSFTENFSPLRPQRRRRKYKTMAVDSSPLTDQFPSDADSASGEKQLGKRKEESPITCCDKQSHPGFRTTQSYTSHTVTAGKRKRSSKSRVDYSYCSRSEFPSHGITSTMDRMEVASVSQESSLSSSEFDSDLNVNNEDTREADDEQSDFFHEPGPACGIPDIVPWWENERTGREFRLGRRKLKGKMPRYTVGKFLQDREHWNHMQSHHFNSPMPGPVISGNMNNSCHGGEFKRRRHVPRNTASIEGITGHCSDSAQESSPKVSRSNGSGGMKSPVAAARKSARKGSVNHSISDS